MEKVEDKSKLVELVEKLEKSKKAVIFCLENESGNVDFHGLSYWASEVERLRQLIKDLI